MKQFKIFWNFEQEEAWLNEMAQKGHHLVNYSSWGVYTFAQKTPQSLQYKVDYQFFWKKSDYISYLTLFEDAGWQHVSGTKYSYNQYFLPKNNQADMEIFSDAASAGQRYKRVSNLCIVGLVTLLLYFILLLQVNDFQISGMIFLTPGLWEKVGAAFWKSFFFELPFAIGRVAGWVVLAIFVVTYGYWAIKSRNEYKRRQKKEDVL